jgi:integrase
MVSVRRRNWKTATGEPKTAWIVDYADNRGRRQRKHFQTKKAADSFRINLEGQLQAGTYRAAAGKVTVQDACESFLEHCKGRNQRDERMTRKMLAVYRGHISNYILHPEHGVGTSKLSQFTARSVGEFRNRIRGVGVTVPTARKVLATLHSILEHAISQDWIATNAARGTKVIGPRGEGSKKVEPPSKEDMRRVIEATPEGLRLMRPRLGYARASSGQPVGVTWISSSTSYALADGSMPMARRVHRRPSRAFGQCPCLTTS